MRRWVVFLCVLWATSASAQLPEGAVVDDAFTFFDLENFDEAVNGQPIHRGWALSSSFRVFGIAPPRSSFKFVIKQGNRTLGETICEIGRFNEHRNHANGPATFFVRDCKDRNQRVDADGAITVEVHFINDATDQVTHVRTHTIQVRTTSTVRGNGEPGAALRYVDRNSEVLLSMMHLQNQEAAPYFGDRNNTRSLSGYGNYNGVTLLVNYHSYERSSTSRTRLRCSVDGRRIELPQDDVSGTETRRVAVTHTFGRGGQDERQHIYYRQVVLQLPLGFDSSIVEQTHDRWRTPSERDHRRAYLNDHPGRWECEWRDGQTVLRTFRWTVGADGKVQPHPEQAAGLSLGVNAFLVETVVPSNGIDTRLHRDSVVNQAFHGLGWRSSEGRAMAQQVPNVGDAVLPNLRAGRGAARAPAKAPRRRR
ncbi:MAG: hypothetical protein KF901_06325 [Myxococcales bacterium]|nr:hypothetical protein [Myxococcales bacterium]